MSQRQHTTKPESPIPCALASHTTEHLNVANSHRRAPNRHRRQHLPTLLHINRRRAPRPNTTPVARERHRPEIRKRDHGVAALKVPDDPLRVLLAERGGRGEGRGDGLALGGVGDDGGPGGRARGGHGQCDGVARAEGDAGEGVGVVRVPLVPGCV